jgi:hypothetical protein
VKLPKPSQRLEGNPSSSSIASISAAKIAHQLLQVWWVLNQNPAKENGRRISGTRKRQELLSKSLEYQPMTNERLNFQLELGRQ